MIAEGVVRPPEVMADVYTLFGTPLYVEGEVVVNERITEAALNVLCDHAKSRGGFQFTSREKLAEATIMYGGVNHELRYIYLCTPEANFTVRFLLKRP